MEKWKEAAHEQFADLSVEIRERIIAFITPRFIRRYAMVDPTERFLKWVRKTPHCWYWTGATTPKGYGVFFLLGKNLFAHRVSFQIHRGEIPKGLSLDHLCLNRACVNPEHLEPVTIAENSRRQFTRRATGIRSPYVKRRREGFCLKGHQLTPEMTFFTKGSKYKRCRSCLRAQWRKAAAKKRLKAMSHPMVVKSMRQ